MMANPITNEVAIMFYLSTYVNSITICIMTFAFFWLSVSTLSKERRHYYDFNYKND